MIVRELEASPQFAGGKDKVPSKREEPVSVFIPEKTRQALAQISESTPSIARSDAPKAFVDRMLPHALEAEQATGIPARFILAQAALESGWGQREIRGVDGAPSFNLFGIKANGGWTGATVDAVTTEYLGGVPRKSTEKFRAYSSYAEAFRDYASMLARSPRYAGVLAAAKDAAGFAQGLQAAGYATDPLYAEKLTRVINHTLALNRTG